MEIRTGTVFISPSTGYGPQDRVAAPIVSSGLRVTAHNQYGGIPVAVTLQQLDTALSSVDRMLYTTSLELKPGSVLIDKCETDVVIFANGHSHNMPSRPQVVIGECKAAGGKITREDAEHLAKVADALPHRRLNVFVLFAKTGMFSEEEIDACGHAQVARTRHRARQGRTRTV